MSRTRGVYAAAVLVPAALLAAVATVSAIRLPLSRDELATLVFASQPLNVLPHAVAHVDAVFGPYYAVMAIMHSVIPGAFGLRLLSVIAGIGTVLIVGVLARRWWGPGAAWVAGLLLALNPLIEQMASTARSYALATFFVALSLMLLDGALRTGRPVRWIGTAVSIAAIGYCHLFALLTVPALLVFAIGAGRGAFLRTLLASAVGGILVVPLALGAFSQRDQVSWIQRPDLKSGLGGIASTLVYRSEGRFQALEAGVLLVTVAALLVGAILVLRDRRSPEGTVERRRMAASLVIAFAPWLILLAFSLVGTPYLRTNYLTPSVVGFALGLGASWAAVRRRWSVVRRPVLAAAATVVAVVAVGVVPFGVSAAQAVAPWRIDDFPGLAARLDRVVHPGDVVVFVQPYSETGVDAGSALYLGDDNFFRQTVARVGAGAQPVLDIRRVRSVRPLVSVPIDSPADGATVWIVHTRSAYDTDDAAVLERDGVECADPSQLITIGSYGLMRLEQVSCS